MGVDGRGVRRGEAAKVVRSSFLREIGRQVARLLFRGLR